MASIPAREERPNLLLITCDELRFDALGCYGNSIIKTPNIDRLAAEGVLLEHYFTQSPVCQPSRATLATGRYPHAHGVKWNWYDLDENETTLQAVLGQGGYHTCAVGKMHFEPATELHGFSDRFFVEGKLFMGEDEYRRHLERIGQRKHYTEHAQRWNNDQNYGAFPSPLRDKDYIDTFIGTNAVRLLSQAAAPFFFWVSFVNPHFPFDPPKPFDEMYDPSSIPVPPDFRQRQDSRIPEQRAASAGKAFHGLSEQLLQQIIAYYYATVSLVDREIGRILDVLDKRELLDNTIVVFTSDHGDLLGNRGMLWKGQMLYDHLIRVPMVIRFPREIPCGKIIADLCQATDVMPTLLDFANMPTPDGVQGKSMRPLLRMEKVPWRDAVFSEAGHVKMIRDFNWKLIFYAGKQYGELYHLYSDRLECENLYDHPDYARRRASLIERLTTLLIESEDPLPQPQPRPGYFDVDIGGLHPSTTEQ